jgi:DNA repair ATPase RecN
MKKIIFTIREYATALKMLRALPRINSDIYKNMQEIKSLSDTLMSVEVDVENCENNVQENIRNLDNLSYELEEKPSRYDVIDIVEDEREYISRDEIGDYTLDADSIRQLVQEEIEEYAPVISTDTPMISPEEYQNIINDVVREIVQRLEA